MIEIIISATIYSIIYSTYAYEIFFHRFQITNIFLKRELSTIWNASFPPARIQLLRHATQKAKEWSLKREHRSKYQLPVLFHQSERKRERERVPLVSACIRETAKPSSIKFLSDNEILNTLKSLKKKRKKKWKNWNEAEERRDKIKQNWSETKERKGKVKKKKKKGKNGITQYLHWERKIEALLPFVFSFLVVHYIYFPVLQTQRG